MFSEKYFDRVANLSNHLICRGSFGCALGRITKEGRTLTSVNEKYRAETVYTVDEYGVFTRSDSFTNTSSEEITVNALKSLFVFDGAEYEVYTQFNCWQHESDGGWQPLVTGVSVKGQSTRTAQHAAPFMVLWNCQEQRGTVFHLLPDCAWEINVMRRHTSAKYTEVVVELGMISDGLSYRLAPGEKLCAPQIICYEAKNKLDMDAYKLHNYMHTNYPRRQMPIIFDTWMYRFANITYENISKQIPLAADLGVEYFFIDAGWYGHGESWSESAGDWVENKTAKLCGRMIDIADEVRAAGMKFGLWLEPERASKKSDAFNEHPEYYIDAGYGFLDFANDEARNWMLGIVFGLIEQYGIEYIKDDYNADLYTDKYSTSFRKYHEGHRIFIDAIKKRYPNVYLSSCASGGMRMELNNYTEFDSTWPSDNESPYVEMRIYKDSIKRLPPQAMERWVCVHSLPEYNDFYSNFEKSSHVLEHMVACGDAVWKNIEGVQQSFMDAYMTCGPIGFSCDLSLLSENAYAHFKEFIAKVKENRDFWMKAVARILCDTPTVTAYQYSDMALDRVVVQVIIDRSKQDRFVVHPVLDENASYRIEDGTVRTGHEIAEEGIEFTTRSWYDNWKEMYSAELVRV